MNAEIQRLLDLERAFRRQAQLYRREVHRLKELADDARLSARHLQRRELEDTIRDGRAA
jgi:transcriptional regulator GlxA family with amidase domain